jgi:hypothetical protein
MNLKMKKKLKKKLNRKRPIRRRMQRPPSLSLTSLSHTQQQNLRY